MKIIYTILFFADTLLLILFTFLLLRMIDNGISTFSLVALLSGITASIISLIFFLRRYLRIPPSGRQS